MKLKGKALLSLLIVLTLTVQLFAGSAAAAYGGESLSWDYEAYDLYGQYADAPELGYAVQVGGQISDLMYSGLSVSPAEGWYVDKVWINADDGSESTALPLTADAGGSADVEVLPDAFVLRYDNGSPVFNDALLSSQGGSYVLHVRFRQTDPGASAEIRDSWGNVVGTGAATLPGDPGSDGSSRFVGWRVTYDNGASVLVGPGATIYPYASCRYEAAYAQKVTLRVSDMTANAGDSLNNVIAYANIEQYNLPYNVSVAGAQVTSDAPDPLQAGTYNLYVSARLVDGNYKDVSSDVAYLDTQVGTLTVYAAAEPEPEPYVPEPEPYVPEPVVPEHTHTPGDAVIENSYPASCTADGYYESVVYCTGCGVELSRTPISVPATGHSAGEAVIENGYPATCTADGSYDQVTYCTVCGAEISRQTMYEYATGHTAGDPVIENEVAATCTEGGHYDSVTYCTRCGAELSRDTVYSDALGHAPGEAVIENQSAGSCTEPGHYDSVVYCTRCGVEVSRDTIYSDAPGHAPGEAVIENEAAATCTEGGHYDSVTYCTRCGAEVSRETVYTDALGHTPGEAVIENEVAATCENGGHYDSVTYCTRCGAEAGRETVYTDALGHNWGDWAVTTPATEEAEGVETRTCLNDPSHTETRSVPKLDHVHDLVKVEAKEASYTEAGNIEYYSCGKCGRLYRDAAATQEITAEDTVIPMLQVTEVTVTVSNQSWTVGSGKQLDPSMYIADGFAEGDPYTVTLRAENYSDAAGEYVIQADVSGYDTAKYHVTVVPGKLTVTPPDIVNVTVTVYDQNLTYNGKAQAVDSAINSAYAVTGLTESDTLTVTIAALGSDGKPVSSVTNAGTYTLQASVSGFDASKYNVTVANSGKLTVSPYALTVTAVSDAKTYDGKPLDNKQVTAALLEGHSIPASNGVSIAVYDANNVLHSEGAVAVGTYVKRITALRIVDAGGNEVTSNYKLSFVDGTLDIQAPEVTPTPIVYAFLDSANGYKWTRGSANGLSFTVNAQIQKFQSVKVDGTALPESCYVISSGSTVVTLRPEYLKNLSAQGHAIAVEFTDGSAATTFVVEEAPVVTPTTLTIYGRNVSKTYDGTPYNLSAYGQNSQGVVTQFHLAQNGQTVAQAVNPGTYDIYLDSLLYNRGGNYSFTIIDSSGRIVATNYNNSSVKIGTLTITGSNVTNVTVTVNDQSWTYDGVAHTPNASGYTISGMQAGDPITVQLSVQDASGRTLSSVTDAGTYTIKANCTGYDSARYNVTVVRTGTLTVSPYKLTLTAESGVKNYDGSPLRNSNVKATALLSGHKFRAGDGVKFSVYDSQGNLIQNGPVAVGTYTKKVTDVHIVDANNIEVTSNYSITRIDGTLTVNNSDGSPKTGDTNNLTLWIMLLAISALLILAIAVLFLRRGKKTRAPKKTDSRPADRK